MNRHWLRAGLLSAVLGVAACGGPATPDASDVRGDQSDVQTGTDATDIVAPTDTSDVVTPDTGIDVPADIATDTPADVAADAPIDAPGDVATDIGTDVPATPVDLTVESYNVGWAGSFVPWLAERRAEFLARLPALTGDVMCLSEVWEQADKDAVAAAAMARFPHSASFTTNLETRVDPFTVPSACSYDGEPVDPPCSETDTVAQLNMLMDCVRTNCANTPGSESSTVTSTTCVQTRCGAFATPLLMASRFPVDGRRCYGCVAPLLPTETIGTIRNDCATNPRAGLAFGGQSSVMVLSRYPIIQREQVVLPGTWNRRTIVRARVELPNRAQVDVYCNHLSPVFRAFGYFYTGPLNCGGATDAMRWQEEVGVQGEILASFVRRATGSGRAIVMGDFNVGPGSTPDGGAAVEAEAPAVYDAIRSAYTATSYTPSFVPQCTFCGSNPAVAPAEPSTWIDHIFQQNIPASAVLSTERIYDAPAITVMTPTPWDPRMMGDAGMPTRMVPLSDHYGLRSVIRIDP